MVGRTTRSLSLSLSLSLTTITNLSTFFFVPSLDRYVGSPRLENVLVATFQRSSVLHSVVPNQGWETTAVPSGESSGAGGAGVGVSSVGHHFYQSGGGVSAMTMRGGGAGGIDRCPDPYRLHYRVDMVSLRVRMVRNVSFRKVIDGHYDRAAAKRRRRRRRRLAEEQKRRESTLVVGGGGGNRGKKGKIDTVSFLQRKAASDGSGGNGGDGGNGGGRGTSVSVDGDIEMIDVLTPLGESKSMDERPAATAKSKEKEQRGGQQRQTFLDKRLQNEQQDVQGQQRQQGQEGGTVFSPSSSKMSEGEERHDVRSGDLDQEGRGGQKAVTTPSLTKETRSEKKEFERATRSGSNVGRSSHKFPKDRQRRRRRKRGETFAGGNGGGGNNGGGKRSSRKGRQSSSDSPRRPGGKKHAVSIRFNPDPDGSGGGGGGGLIDLGAAAVGGVKRGVTRGVTNIFRRMNENYHGKIILISLSLS